MSTGHPGGPAAAAEPAPTPASRLVALRATRIDRAAGDPSCAAAVAAVVRAADGALGRGPWSVTDKASVPAGADRHDFVHVAEYAWPDPGDPDGPWVLRDGRVNPAARGLAADGRALAALADAAWLLAVAHRLDGRPCRARRVVELVDTWFLDPATAMRPRLDRAVLVPGHDRPATWGLSRLHPLLRVLDAAALVGPDGRPPAGLAAWCGELLSWLLGSELFRAELARANNHATGAIALALALGVCAGDDRVGALAERAVAVVDGQVDAAGDQPAELARTRSFFYSGHNLAAAYRLADLTAACGVDLADPGGALHRATRRLLPALADPATWPDPGPEPSDVGRHGDLLVRAAVLWPLDDALGRALRSAPNRPGPGAPVWVECGVAPPDVPAPPAPRAVAR